MSLTKLLAVSVSAFALAFAAAEPVLAQAAPPPGSAAATTDEGERADPARRTRDPRGRRNRNQAPPRPSAEEVKAAAQTQLTAAGITCEITEATLVGVNAEQQSLYEAVCASGSGYLALAATPPQVFNCLELAGQAETSRLRDPEATVGQQCTLPANQNGLVVIGGFARDAGLACTVDQAGAIGKSNAGNLIYEVGCAERTGYWVEKIQDGWKTTPCWDLAFSNIACRYTPASEVLASWQGVLAGSPAASCDVREGRRVGRDAQGLTVYEVKCGAGDGYFVRIDAQWKAQQFHPCATAQNIGGGCTLTPAAAAAPATTEQ
ncbi:MAG: hypothetical protein Q8R45_07520 [Brevundimonas sp.]|uniref:hypothetical protein n=1 Tax=Brevundimonas sp. TaxID=1871086 RepID=UPI002716AAA7|nr:hypothetical protein [Brevundimonas sp.]MDO9589015.1 hypothetical protein [Brevundimonas sp.]MDP3368571.1 hypothetical protein [Brevundimonas sp.]MDP3656794.1 hypothetical protein [Brevundimonas sp.]MDZ4112324.1 hypothetical protein [Brevundimonas sp.]